jgi:hypothetical protein
VPTPARSINSSSSSSSKDPPTHVPPAPPTHGIQAAARIPLPMCPNQWPMAPLANFLVRAGLPHQNTCQWRPRLQQHTCTFQRT